MTPDGSLDAISPGTYYLTGINDKHHRAYSRK
jgi:Hydroxymethylglutaryl-coenzyme A synthase C terminal